jgi:hypothetical protein
MGRGGWMVDRDGPGSSDKQVEGSMSVLDDSLARHLESVKRDLQPGCSEVLASGGGHAHGEAEVL